MLKANSNMKLLISNDISEVKSETNLYNENNLPYIMVNAVYLALISVLQYVYHSHLTMQSSDVLN